MKKNWMKLLALALSVMMVLSLFTACDLLSKLENDDDDDGKVRGTVSQAAQAAEFSLGTTTGSKYENEFIGIGFAAPDGWTFYTDAQIKELNQATADMMDEEYAEVISRASLVYDMMVQDSATGSSVNINMEKATAAAVKQLDLEEYLENNLSAVSDSLSSMGFTVTDNKISDVTLAGKATKGLWLKSTYSGVEMYQLVMPIKCNDYIAVATVTTVGGDTTSDVLDCFYAVN